jgi:hypothetical protein
MNVEAARIIGQKTFGPIFTAWGQLLLREAHRRRLQELLFIARDGFLLLHVSKAFIAGCDESCAPRLSYLHLSRCATRLPAARKIDTDAIAGALSLRSGMLSLAGLLEYHGIPASAYLPVLYRAGLEPQTPVGSAERGQALLGQPDVAALIAEEAWIQRTALLDYLVERHSMGSHPAALVDVGWRGSIQANLHSLLGTLPRLVSPIGLYVGLWREDGLAPLLPHDGQGLAGDLRRGRCLHESAPWQVSLLLEAVCRESCGTVQSFRMVNGRGTAIFTDVSDPAGQAELASSVLATAVRDGILDFVLRNARKDCWQLTETTVLRHNLQQRLLRLAFFPDAAEIALGEGLVHTESHDRHWSTPLILPRPLQPLRAPRRWLAGMASPWRGGYVMATGRPLAWLYRGVESSLITVPPLWRATVRRVALRFAGSLPLA